MLSGSCSFDEVLLHKGLLYNPVFAGMVLEASRVMLKDGDGTGSEILMSKQPSITSSTSGAEFRQGMAWNRMITVNADAGFVYPGHEFYTTLQGQGLGVDGLGPDVGPYLVDAYKAIFKKIAMPFSCSHAAEAMLLQQTKEIGKRLVASMESLMMGKTSTGRAGSAAAELLNSVSPASLRTVRDSHNSKESRESKDRAVLSSKGSGRESPNKQLSPTMRPTTAPVSDSEGLGRLGLSDSDSEVGDDVPVENVNSSSALPFELPSADHCERISF